MYKRAAIRQIRFLLIAMIAFGTIKTFAQSPTQELAELTPLNAAHIQQLGILSRGTISGLEWSPDGQVLAVKTFIGAWLYNSEKMDEFPKYISGVTSFSPDWKYIAHWTITTDFKELVEIIDGRTQELVSTLPPHEGVRDVVFSPDGELLTSVTINDEYYLWETLTGRQLKIELPDPTIKSVRYAQFTPDSKTLVIGAETAQSIRFENKTINKTVLVIPNNGSLDNRIQFNSDSTRALLNGHLWDLIRGKEIKLPDDYYGNLSVLSPSGKTLALYGQITIWLKDLVTGTEIDYLDENYQEINELKFSSDGELLAVSSSYGALRLWDATTGKFKGFLKGHMDDVNHIAFSPDGSTLASAERGILILWDIATQQPIATIKSHSAWVHDIVFSPDSNYVASINRSGPGASFVRLWDMETRSLHAFLNPYIGTQYNVAFSADSNRLVVHAMDTSKKTLDSFIQIWDVSTGKLQWEYKVEAFNIDRAVAFSPDNYTLAYNNGKEIPLLNATTTKRLGVLKGHTNYVHSLMFNSDGSLLASSSQDKTVRLWDTKNLTLIHTLKHGFEVGEVIFNPDSTMLVTWGAQGSGGKAKVWNVITGRELAVDQTVTFDWNMVVAMNPDWTIALAYVPYEKDSYRLALVDVSSGESLKIFPANYYFIQAAAFSPDGKLLLIGNDNGGIFIWGVPKQ